MKPFKTFFVSVAVFLFTVVLSAQTSGEFNDRRKKVIENMEPNSVMIIKSGESSGIFNYPRLGGYFYYLTGINEPGTFLVLRSKSTKPSVPSRFGRRSMSPGPEILFIKPADPSRANWDALTLGIEGAKKKGGFANVRPSGEFDEYFGKILLSDPVILYMNYEKSENINDPLTPDEQLFKKARNKGASFEIKSPSIILNPMLAIKSPAEIEILKKAINITAEAHKEAMRSIQPGMYEYQLQAIIRFVYRMNGAPGIGFPCIIGSGINSVVLHWMENSRKMEEGDIVVVDIGAEYSMYWADITRTIPVNGKYSKRQKEIYEIVLKANEEAIKMVAPGIDFADISKKADEILADGMQRIGLIKEKSEFKKYYYHGLGHHIGIINARGDRLGKLEPGMVITIEPGIYIREEKLGVRIEDDVLVTETGYDVLTKNIPKKIEEIEKLMSEKGMDYKKNLIVF